MTRSQSQGEPVAVVGMGAMLPGASSPAEAWRVLCEGRPQFDVPDRYDIASFCSPDSAGGNRGYVNAAGFVKNYTLAEEVDAEIRAGDWSADADLGATMLRHSAAQALTGLPRQPGDQWLSVVAGCAASTSARFESALVSAAYRRLLAEELTGAEGGRWQAELAGHVLATRYENGFCPLTSGLQPWLSQEALAGLVPEDCEFTALDAACSSGLHALDLAVSALREGSISVALCAAVAVTPPTALALFSATQALTRTGGVRPFDAAADGVLPGEGSTCLVLKPLRRARADGDPVLGVIHGTGVASDGKDRSVHAPAPAGQRLAIERGWADAGVTHTELDWFVAHGTGTLLGDEVEADALQGLLAGRDRPARLSANKALFGHTAANAGLLNVLHVLLALRHGSIPRQASFDRPAPFLDPALLEVPTTETEWPAREDRPRLAGVSAFGLGGADGHAVIGDPPPTAAGPGPMPEEPEGTPEPVVVVATGSHFPETDHAGVLSWLHGEAPAPPAEFGTPYPLPPVTELLLPPVTARQIDRSHVMGIQAAASLPEQLGDAWPLLRARTGVVTATTPCDRRILECALRIYTDDTAHVLDEDTRAALVRAVDARVEPLGADAFAGTSTNVAAARIANHYDLRGPCVAVFGAEESAEQALRTARRYLHAGSADLVLVCGTSANTTPEWAEVISEWRAGRQIAEGTVLLALARGSTAREHQLPVLAELEHTPPESPCTPEGLGERTYLAADGLLEHLAAFTARPHTAPETTSEAAPRAASEEAPQTVAPGTPLTVRAADAPLAQTHRPEAPATAFPDGTLLLTNAPELAAELPCSGRTVVNSEPDFTPQHLRILLRCGAADDPSALSEALELHDRAFSAAQHLLPAWESPGSVAVVAVGDFGAVSSHPHAGLFAGLVNGLSLEYPQHWYSTVLSPDDDGISTAFERLADEARRPEGTTQVAAYRQGSRRVHQLAPLEDSGSELMPLDDDSVVLVTGGARGITVEILAALAAEVTPTLCLLGRTVPADTPVPERAEFIRHARQAAPDRALPNILAEHTRLSRAAEVADNLSRLESLHGPKVHYLPCDLTDQAQVDEAVGTVLSRHGRVDAVIHAATEVRSCSLAAKTLSDFRLVRAVKVLGHAHLRQALADSPPRLWCDFSSLGSVAPVPGDFDYAAGNEYLNHSCRTDAAGTWADTRHLTILWSQWEDVGAAASRAHADNLRALGWSASITPQEGAAQFLHMLRHSHDASTWTFCRTVEREAISRSARAVELPTGCRTFELDPDGAERWLHHHRVKGNPSVPGMFALELAARTARSITPDLHVTGFRDLVCHAPLYTRDNQPLTVRTEAFAVDDNRVRVRVLTDRTSPRGVPLRRDIVCDEVTVLMAEHRPELPAPSVELPGPTSAPLAIRTPNRLVQLSGPLAATTDHRAGPGTAAARFALDTTAWAECLEDTQIPFLLLDAMGQTAALETSPSGQAPLASLDRVAAVDLCTPLNDLGLVRRYGTDTLLYRPPGRDEVVAVADGEVLASVRGLTGKVLGNLDLTTGELDIPPGRAKTHSPMSPGGTR